MLNLSPKIEISDFHVFQHYVSLKFPFSVKDSASSPPSEARFVNNPG
jgi:hypothetical protein